MIYRNPFYAKPLARHAMIDEDSSQTIIKSLCPFFFCLPSLLFFTQSHDLTGHRRFLRRNSVSPTYKCLWLFHVFSSCSWHFGLFGCKYRNTAS